MASIESVTSTPYDAAYAASESGSGATARAARKNLGQDDFLKLLATQFQSQDPLKPMEDTAFIAQMAQFSALEQSRTLTQELVQLRTMQDLQTANSYIGRKVTIDAGDGATVSGEVSGVDVSSGTPRLIVGDSQYSLSAVLLVEPGTPPPAPQSPNSDRA